MGNLAVKNWFDNGCNYSEGVQLMEQLCNNKMLVKKLKRNSFISNQNKLKYELGKYIDTPSPKEIIVKGTPSELSEISELIGITAAANEKKQTVFFHELPTELQPELLKANMLFKECCLLKVQLNDLPVNAENEALRIQLLIDEKRSANAICWKNIDYFLEHRVLPMTAKSEFDDLSPAQLVKRQQYMWQNISKKNKALKHNRDLLKKVESVKEKSRLERLIAKQESYLLKYENELGIINKLIDGKAE